MLSIHSLPILLFFFFNDTATTEIYTLSLHDALPICLQMVNGQTNVRGSTGYVQGLNARVLMTVDGIPMNQGDRGGINWEDRKSTRLNSSHGYISYAVFCLKKKKNKLLIIQSACDDGE